MDNTQLIIMYSATLRSELKLRFDKDMKGLELNNQEGEYYIKLFGIANELAGQLVHYAEALRVSMEMLAEQRGKVASV